ncbi:plasmid segregation protein ParM domain-containing protein [Escherichia coli]
MRLLAVHHALLNSGLAPQPVSLTVTLPIGGCSGGCKKIGFG